MSGDGGGGRWSGPTFPGPEWSSGPPPGDEPAETEVTDWRAELTPAREPSPEAEPAATETEPELAAPEPEAEPELPDPRAAEAEADALAEARADALDDLPHPATITDYAAAVAEPVAPPPVERAPSSLPVWATTPGALPVPIDPPTQVVAAAVAAEVLEPEPVAADETEDSWWERPAVPVAATVVATRDDRADIPWPDESRGAPPAAPDATPGSTAPDETPVPETPLADTPAEEEERDLAPLGVAAAVAHEEQAADPVPDLAPAADRDLAPLGVVSGVAVAEHAADAHEADLPDAAPGPDLVPDHAPVAVAAAVAHEAREADALSPDAPATPSDLAPGQARAPVPPSDGPTPVDAPLPPGAPRWHRVIVWAGPALLVFLVSLALDLRTIMPGLGYWDTGEFQALGPVLGIAHPTGYPSYTLLLWLASVVLQPFGEAAFRANLLSALLVSGAAAFTAIAAVQLTRRWWIGIISGLALALTEIGWRNALRADPHAFQVFLVGLLLVLLIAWADRERAGNPRAGRWLIAASAAFALAVTNHGLTVALAPGVAVYVLLVQPRILWKRWKTVLACVATLAVLTVAIYAYLPIRSSMNPPLDYAHPANWVNTNAEGEVTGGFRYLVLGEQFQGQFLRIPADPLTAIPKNLVDGAEIAGTTLRDNLGSLLTILAVLGIPLGLWRRPRETIMTGLWFALTFTFALGYPNADITRYYLAPLLVACVWAALAIDGLWALVRWGFPSLARGPDPARPDGGTRRLAGALIGGVAAILLLSPTFSLVPARFDELDASGDTGARRWLDATLEALPQDAVVVSWWSYSTPLWYGRYVENRRPDLTIIDDRDIVDDDLGNVPTVVADWLAQGTRPVFVIRLDRDLAEIEAGWQLEPLDGMPRGEPVYRVVGPAGGG